MDVDDVERAVEALLFAAAEPLSAADLARRLPEGADVGRALATLKADYQGRGVTLECVADRWRFATSADLAYLMTEEREVEKKLSKAAMETLAIIAYHQPVTRADIEAIRGVGLSRGTLDLLLEIGWVRLRGRRRSPGRPVTFGTTDAFLEHFALQSLADLPGAQEMKAQGLLSLDLPAGFTIPDPSQPAPDEDLLEPGDAPEFHQDFLGRGEDTHPPGFVVFALSRKISGRAKAVGRSTARDQFEEVQSKECTAYKKQPNNGIKTFGVIVLVNYGVDEIYAFYRP